MTIEKNQIIRTKGKKPILFDLYFKEEKTNKPVVIFCHGYKGFKDWGTWNLMAQSFAEAGFCFIKFNFSHNGGTVEDPIDFPDLDAFANNNYSKELEDLDRIINYLETEEVSLIGHSRGGGIVLIKAEEDSRVKKVITWAGVSDFRVRFQEDSDAFEQFRNTGVTYVENSRTKQQLPHYWQFYENFIANEERLTIQRAVQDLSKPLLIIHGDADTTVDLKEAQLLHKWNRSKSKLEIIPESNHVFGATHPWLAPHMPADLKKTVKLSINFLM